MKPSASTTPRFRQRRPTDRYIRNHNNDLVKRLNHCVLVGRVDRARTHAFAQLED